MDNAIHWLRSTDDLIRWEDKPIPEECVVEANLERAKEPMRFDKPTARREPPSQSYHVSDNDVTVLLEAVEALKKKSAANPDKDQSRFSDNIRAIEAYMKYFQNNEFNVLENPRPRYVHGNVQISTAPDLYVEEEAPGNS